MVQNMKKYRNRLKALERGANSELYNALRKIWYGRVSPVSNALQFQLWYSAGMDLSNNASAQAMWTGEEMVAAYKNTHGGLEPPKIHP